MRHVLGSLEIALWLLTGGFLWLWITRGDDTWEPWTILCGLGAAVIDGIRRFRNYRATRRQPLGEPTTQSPAQAIIDRIHERPLSESLSDALRFAKKTGDGELERWCRLELYGYLSEGGMQEGDVVPTYRRVDGRWVDEHGQILDLSPHPELAEINRCPLRWGAKMLEDVAGKKTMQTMTIDFAKRLFRQHMGIENLHFEFHPIAVRGTLDTIKNRLAEKLE